MSKKQRRSKSLEKVARTVKDADDFIDHVFGIASAYRSQFELETASGGREVRQALRAFEKHANALQAWLRSATQQARSSPAREALNRLSIELHGTGSAASAQAATTQLWLASAAAASERAVAALKRSSVSRGPRTAAEALRATFEHHGLKVSYRVSAADPSDAIRLFCAIAKDAGDLEMTPELARDWLKNMNKAERGAA